jgi:RNA polymerase sigma factor (sigma-70 family)
VNPSSDQQLLREYTTGGSEPAFAELVRRYVGFVYSSARRMVVYPHLAEDVAQDVFVALARNAPRLTNRTVLVGWLHCTTRNVAAKAIRTEERRRTREQEAVTMWV